MQKSYGPKRGTKYNQDSWRVIMKYETKMKFDKHIISEEYVVDSKTYQAELEIHNIGFITGMAGYDACTVEVILYQKGEEFPIGRIGIDFPMILRLDGTNTKRMLEPCSLRCLPWNDPPERKFTPYAEREIERAVTACIRQKEGLSTKALSLSSISVSVGDRDTDTGGGFFTFLDEYFSLLFSQITDCIEDRI